MTVRKSENGRLNAAGLEGLIFGSEDQDARRFTARLGGLLYLAGGGVLATTMWLPRFDDSNRSILGALAVLAVIVGLLIPKLPWHTWPARAYLVPVTLSFLMIGMGSVAVPGVENPYQSMYMLAFMFIGLTQTPGTALVMAPIAAMTMVVPEWGEDSSSVLVAVLIRAPIWVIVGEAMAQSTTRLKESERSTGRLLEASSSLAQATDEAQAAGLTAQFASELLAADWVIVLTESHSDELVLTVTGRQGTSIPLGTSWTTDELGDQDGGRLITLPSTNRPKLVDDAIEHHPELGSLLQSPLGAGGHRFGLIVIGWRAKRQRLPRAEKRSLRLLSLESARALARLRETRMLEIDAETDPLTGLYNRRSYNKALEQLLPGDVVVLADLDHFKSVNDRFGHATGDEVLVAFAKALSKIARKSDSVARYGGEEFAWILPGAGKNGAEIALKRLQALWLESDPVATFSAGYAIHTAHDVPTTTLARADHALYQAKNNGRNRIELAPAPTQEQL